MAAQRGNSSYNGASFANGASGSAGPYAMTIAGVTLNGVPEVYGHVPKGATAT